MANNKIFTMPLAASQTYVIDDNTSASAITIANDASSGATIDITGTISASIGGVSTPSSAISLLPKESITVTSDTPLSLSIVVGKATTGKLILVV